MSIAKTKLISISANNTLLNNVLKVFITLESFHPILATQLVEKVHGLTTYSPNNAPNEILKELDEIEKNYDVSIPITDISDENVDVDNVLEYISVTHEKFKNAVVKYKEQELELVTLKETLVHIKNLKELDISLDDLFNLKYLTARIGKMPNESVEKLKYFRSQPFIFKSFEDDADFSYSMYITSNEYKREVDNVFSSLFFERVFIPDFVHGTPEDAVLALEEKIKAIEEKITIGKEKIDKLKETDLSKLSKIKSQLILLSNINDAKKYVLGMGDRFSINGFIEESRVDILENTFSSIKDVDIEIKPADSDFRITPPTKLKNNWFNRPFSMFVEMYGVPSYGSFDPTPVVAITYCLLFGIMFGDLGQGLAIMLIGFLLSKFKKMRLGDIMMRIGGASAIFGFLYGSVFGYEHALDFFYVGMLGLKEKPINVMATDFTMTLLIIAVGIGAVLILISILINIVTRFKKREYSQAILSQNGIMGFIFYSFIVVAIALKFTNIANLLNAVTITLLAVVPLLIIFLKEPITRIFHKKKMFPEGFKGFLIEGIFELFEIVLSYVTNTVSFLRVGGFVLSHAGMMMVVETLMKMVGNGASGIMVSILGNLFVMGLEGLIVGIQVLRLEFYEMFSRYYEGNGIKFVPLKKL